MPEVSIIVPNYNHAEFLTQRLDSIFNQIYKDYEVILLDDASNDNSVEILKRYSQHPKVSHFIINDKNSGSPFKQWQKGISLARGKYIWLAESDDYCEDTFLDKLIKAFNDNEVVISYCQSRLVDSKGQTLYDKMTYWTDDLDKNKWLNNYIIDGEVECRNYLSKKCTITNASSVIFKKECTERIDWDINKFKQAGDWLFWIKLSMLGKISFLSETLNYFRFSPNNTRKHDSKYKVLRNIKEELWILHYLKKQKLISKSDFRNRKRVFLKKAHIYIPKKLWILTKDEIREMISIIKYHFIY